MNWVLFNEIKLKKRAPFGIFQHPFCCKTPKRLKGRPFAEKSFSEKVERDVCYAENYLGARQTLYQAENVLKTETDTI